ncbi:uncharacterized protein PV09_02500 [Verruconis gallopava]|uniref:Uncharacterized protein n=1 Tax=Verruconis gallopava TaxID=253628 RepID=A0A0D2AJR9_9PEZI|nr:uncharacterized protein PV09_02500 [Verruconis gallopava]KIW06820.1 hypothetical protein PV09_02500 [Verruconis gallopava]
MSSESRPISPTRFRAAIQDLPLGNLYAKAAELRNSIDHLKRSNNDLAEFAEDSDCKLAITENLEVIQRMEDRILMLQQEVERRGMRWAEGDNYKEGMLEPGENVVMNGMDSPTPEINGNPSESTERGNTSTSRGRLTDEQLRRLISERIEQSENEDEGVHL